MADFSFDVVRQAAAVKFAAIAGIKSATKDELDNWRSDVEVKVLPAAYELLAQPDATQEIYRLTIPCSLLLPIPAQKARSQPLANTLTRAIQVAWRTNSHLGLVADYDSSQVSQASSRIESMAPDAEGAYADVACLEWAISLVVEMVEVFHSLRTV